MNKLLLSALGLAALGFISCDDETYDNWTKTTEKQTYSQETIIDLGLKATPSFSTVNLADAAEGTTYTIDIEYSLPANANVAHSIAITKENDPSAATTYYTSNDNAFAVDGSKIILTAEQLQNMVTKAFGKAPEAREFYIVDKMVYSLDNQVFTTYTTTAKVVVTPTAPVIESAYYVIGDYPGWDFKAAATAKFSRADESVSVYDDPVFTITVPAPTNEDGERVDYWFRFLSQSALDAADWSGTIGAVENGLSDLEGSLYFKDEGGHGDACIKMLASDGAKFYKIELNMMDYRYKITPLSFEEYIYVPGNAQGWKPETAAALKHEGEGIYKGFVVMDGDFKFTRERAWAAEYNAGDFKTVSEGLDVSAGAGQNIKYTGERALYHFTVDVVNGSIEATKIEYMGVTGDFSGWNEGSQMTWNDEELCFELKDASVTSAGWKFRANGLTDPNWKINLGGDLNDLSYGGSDIKVVGSTIRLFPCRTDSDKFYATVE